MRFSCFYGATTTAISVGSSTLELRRLGIESSDPEAVATMLAEPTNRFLLAAFRLVVKSR